MKRTTLRNLYLLLILVIVLQLASCSRVTPSGFWLRYKSDFITEQLNDQGPRGGTLAIHWTSGSNTSKFNSAEIIKTAEANSWVLLDSLEIDKSEFANMMEIDEPTIRFRLKNFKPNAKNDDYWSEPFPRWMNEDSKLYRFKTGWLIFYPGTDDATAENGFVLLSKDGKQMSAYHFWGE